MTTPLDPAAWLAAIVESSDDAIVSKTIEGTITSWNKSAERLYGYTAEEAIGRSIMLIVPEGRQDEELRILEVIASGELVDHFETERRAKDGRCIPVSLTISPVRDPSGRVVGASKVARDISERRANEAHLRDMNRRKDEFLAMLGHELRNPLAPILTAVDLLERKTDEREDLQAICGLLKRQVSHMVRLLDDLLDVGRVSSGKIRLRMEPVDMREIVARAVEATRPAIDAHGHTLDVSVPDTPVGVCGDDVRLVQMLSNIIHNAIKYTPRGGFIGISVRATADGEAQLGVVDNGVGMAPDLLRDVFELFVQGEKTLDRAQGGLGLGLTLVRSIAGLHGGRAQAHSRGEGAGSTFTVSLPMQAQSQEAGVEPSAPAALRPAGGCHVVIVDDNVDGAVMMAELAKLMNHSVSIAHDARSAIGTIRDEQPDVAFVDIGLPDMNGLTVARMLRDGGYGGTLVAITGYGQPEDLERSHSAGFDDHWVKPIDPARMEQLLARHARAAASG